VAILAPAVVAATREQQTDIACDMILARLDEIDAIFQNVNFNALYEGLL
jgi:hypothetical protein